MIARICTVCGQIVEKPNKAGFWIHSSYCTRIAHDYGLFRDGEHTLSEEYLEWITNVYKRHVNPQAK